MQTNLPFSIYKPFPHPSCLVEHLQFLNSKLHAVETQLNIHHTITPKSKTHHHRSLQHTEQIMKNKLNVLTGTDVRSNALETKTKINIPGQNIQKTQSINFKGRNKTSRKAQKQNNALIEQTVFQDNRITKTPILKQSKMKAKQDQLKLKQFENQNAKLNDLILRMRKQQVQQTQSYQIQLVSYEKQIQKLHRNKFNNTNDDYLNVSLEKQLDNMRGLYLKQRQKGGQYRKQIHQLKRTVFELEESNIDLVNEVQQLREIVNAGKQGNNLLEIKNLELEDRAALLQTQLCQINAKMINNKSHVTPLFNNSLSVLQVVYQIIKVFEKSKSFDFPNYLIPVRSELLSLKQTLIDTLSKLQQVAQKRITLNNPKILINGEIYDFQNQVKQTQRQLNLQCYDNSLYNMMRCQAVALEQFI